MPTKFFPALAYSPDSKTGSLDAEGLDIGDILPNAGDFFFIGGIGIIPLLNVRQTVAKGTIAGHLAVLSEAARGHERGPGCDAGVELFRDNSKISDMPLGIKYHFVLRTHSLFN